MPPEFYEDLNEAFVISLETLHCGARKNELYMLVTLNLETTWLLFHTRDLLQILLLILSEFR